MIVMAGTSAPGGIAQVIKGYDRDGIFDKWEVRWVKTHVAGTRWKRWAAAAVGLGTVCFWLTCRRVELVHTHAAMRGSFWRKSLLVGMCRLFRVPVILHLHGSEMRGFHASQTALGRRCIRATLEQADRVVVLSAGWADFVAGIAPDARQSILPNYAPPIAAAANIEAGRRSGDAPPGFVFLFLGALIKRKGIFELIPAFARLTREYPDVMLWLGGEGDSDRVRSLLAENHLHNVRLLGWVDEEHKNRLLLSADAFVLPSRNENLPMAIIEAMSAALPIVTTRVGGIPEMLVDGQDGFVVAPSDIDALYQALRRVRHDPAAAAAMGRSAERRYRAEFSPEVGLPRMEAIYRELGISRAGER
ncbi:glycosyltransferase [Xylophilus sp. Kf1]|nr:glycosyltransferase [Xylophilus sp. Kf1]